MAILSYNREAAVAYARRWAFSRNPAFYDFSRIGGDCTNFASQCLYAGCGIMNFTPDFGWYYRSVNDRSAAWTGVEYFYRFLTENRGNAENGFSGEGTLAENSSYFPQGGEMQPQRVVGSGAGPFAIEVPVEGLEIGDFVQFGKATGDFYHTPVVVGFQGTTPLLAAHSNDAYDRPLTTYRFDLLRCIHILGART